MSIIQENLRATLLSLKQISDRLKLLNTTSVTKSEALAYKNEIIEALGDIDFTEIIEALGSIDEKIDDISTELEDVAKEVTLQAVGVDAAAAKTAAQGITGYALQGSNTTATNTAILAAINTIPDLKVLYSARFEQNQDGQDTYTVVMPIVAGIEESESGNSVIVTM